MNKNKLKNNEIIVGPGKNESNLTVIKSNPLFSLWKSDMSLPEFKILDTYLSRINPKDETKRTVMFTKGELEKLLGVTQIRKQDLSNRLNNLGRFVDVEGPDNEIHKIALFEEVYGSMDDSGQWIVQLTCTPSAMKYIFNVENIGYLRYKLQSITSIGSRYTYIMFLYLEKNRYRKTWNVDIKTLRELLNCNEELYDEYKYFNQRILKKCHREITEKTACNYNYTPIKVGKRVAKIQFTLETLSDFKQLSEKEDKQLSLDFETYGQKYDDMFQEMNDMYQLELTPDQLGVIKREAILHAPLSLNKDDEIRAYDYIVEKIMLMKSQNDPVEHKFGWLKKAIIEDFK